MLADFRCLQLKGPLLGTRIGIKYGGEVIIILLKVKLHLERFYSSR